MKTLKRALWVIIAIMVLGLVVVAVCEISVFSASKGRMYSDVEEIPHREVGLLLGTNPKGRWGGANMFYNHRIDAAVALYEAGKVDRFLISGAKKGSDYDEPQAMREALVAIRDALCEHPYDHDDDALANIANAALSAPPRQCDVGTPGEQRVRFESFCKRKGDGFSASAYCAYECPCGNKGDCKLAWAQMPYEADEKGDGDGSK